MQGLALLVVVAMFVGFTIAVYAKVLPWQRADTVSLHVSRIGNELAIPSDVKLRGVLVGRVSAAHTTGNTTTLTLKIQKSQMASIPSNVVARILPKTLFGEKYVQLMPPKAPSKVTFASLQAAGKPVVISQDDSRPAIEIQTVFTHLVPLLHTLNPVQLSYTLNALSTALSGRGNELGANLARTGTYIGSLNTDLPTIEHDIRGIADLSDNLNDAAPDLLAVLRNLTTTAKTFTVKADTYAQFLLGTAGFAREATTVVGTNAQNLVNLADISVPVLDTYSHYSVDLECLANGLALYDRSRLESVFRQGPFLNITLTPVNDRGTYTTSDMGKNDTPSYNDYKPPAQSAASYCGGLPYGNHPLDPKVVEYPTSPNLVSANEDEGGLLGTGGTTGDSSGLTSLLPTGTSGSTTSASPPAGVTSGAGSLSESTVVATMLSSLTGKSTSAASDGLNDLLLGPMVRGMTVTP